MTSPSGFNTNPMLKNRPGNSGWRALAWPITNAFHWRASAPSASVSGPGTSIAHSRANVAWSRSSTSSLKPCSAPSGMAIRRTGRSRLDSQAAAFVRCWRCSRLMPMSDRVRMPRTVGMSPTAVYGLIMGTTVTRGGAHEEGAADRGRHPRTLVQHPARPAGGPGALPAPGDAAAAGTGRPGAHLPPGDHRPGGVAGALDRDPRPGPRHLPHLAAVSALPGRAAGEGSGHLRTDLLQVRGRLAGRLAQAEHGRRPGLLQ